MSLLSIAKGIKETGYDPRKDAVNGAGVIPAGKYAVMLKATDFKVSESGWESLLYSFEIKEGEFAKRKESVSFGTLEEWKGKDIKWSVERTIKFFQKVMAFAGDTSTTKDYEDGLAMKLALDRKSVGQLFYLVITETKRDDKVFRQYDLEPYVEPVNVDFDVDDEDLPF